MGLLLHSVINIINVKAIIYNIAFLRFLGPNLPGPNLPDRIYRDRIYRDRINLVLEEAIIAIFYLKPGAI